MYTLLYRGTRYHCNVCNSDLSTFITVDSGDLVCPKCSLLPRTRRLYELLKSELVCNNKKVLDFSPSRAIYRRLKAKLGSNYISTDLSGDFTADYKYNITHLPLEDNSMDLIICYHVLEHVMEDHKAMKELYRILKVNGKCIIQTPFKEGDIYEDASITQRGGL